MQLNALVIGGPLAVRGAVCSDLCSYGIGVVREGYEDTWAFNVAVLIHPDALQLVAAYRATVPVVVVAPPDDDLGEDYLRLGVEELVGTDDAFRPSYVARAFRRALARRSATAALERAARIDPLTELLNRRGLEEALPRVARRQSGTVALLVDIDDFKAVNTKHGLSGGDAALRRVADILRLHARPTDLVARAGGDEFMVIVPGVGFVSGCGIAERLRTAVAETGVTVSIGLSVIGPNDCTTVDYVIAQTQGLLQAGKARGKNRVEVYDEASLAM